MPEPSPRPNRALLAKLAVAALILLVAAVLVARGIDLKGLSQQLLAYVRGAGPVVFFTAQALLPSIGAPQTAFSLTAGSLFGAQLGMPLVALLSALALVANMALSYWLASRLLRPPNDSAWRAMRRTSTCPSGRSDSAASMVFHPPETL